jgi:hypothetical protein
MFAGRDKVWRRGGVGKLQRTGLQGATPISDLKVTAV